VATFTLIVVLVTGAVRGVVEVGSLAALTGTSYGVVLLVKVGLVVVLVALGALNHYRLVPALSVRPGAARSFRLNSGGEVALALAVLLATAVLTGLAPPSSAGPSAGLAPAATGVTAVGSDYATTMRVTLSVTPGEAGANRYKVSLADYDTGRPPDQVRAVDLELTLPAKPELGSSRVKLKETGAGEWSGSGMELAVAGFWKATVVVQQTAGGVSVPLEVPIGAP
jgi:copper transport protein